MWCASVVNTLCGAPLASSASFCCRVEMASRPEVRVICPSKSHLDRSAASLPRVPWAGFPALRGTISRLRLLIHRPAALRCLRLAVPCLVSRSLPPAGHRSGGPGPLLTRRPHRSLRTEWMSPSRFLDDPCVHALLFDPSGAAAPGPARCSCCGLPPSERRRLRKLCFRGSITRPARPLCTLRRRGRPRTTQHSVPVDGPSFPAQDFHLPGRSERFPMDSLPAMSPLPPPPGKA